MQNLDPLGHSAPTYAMVQTPEGSNVVVGWPSQYVQADQVVANGGVPNGATNAYLMNVIKPDQQRVRMDSPSLASSTANANIGVPSSPNPASVITATYNPTYNRCLPKILSDLDCEMKIKQVLKCIENILLEGGENDQQQSYKLPDRSSSPQLKRIKVKEDEERELIMSQTPINMSANGTAPLSKSTNKSNVRINVKVEPPTESEKAQRNPLLGMFPADAQQVTGSPRTSYDRLQTQPQPQAAQVANGVPKPATAPRAFSFEPYSYPGSNNNTQFAQQVFTQQQQAQAILLQQQQHLASQQQHIHQQLQQQLMNNGITIIPQLQSHQISNMQHALQYSLPPHMQPPTATQPHSPSIHARDQSSHPPQIVPAQPQHHASSQASESSTSSTSFPVVQMDEFPFPVFSNSILEEVNQYKHANRDDTKKDPANDPANPFYFNGATANAAALQYQQIAQQLQQAGALSDPDQRNLLTSSLSQLQQSLFLQIPHPLSNISGIEEDDKWILSLLNIDNLHDSSSTVLPAPGF